MNIVSLALTQDHNAPAARTVADAVGLKGVSTLLGMAVSPEHRDTVVGYRDCAVWQALHCHERGDGHERDLWFRVAGHITATLAGSKHVIQHKAALAQRHLARRPA